MLYIVRSAIFIIDTTLSSAKTLFSKYSFTRKWLSAWKGGLFSLFNVAVFFCPSRTLIIWKMKWNLFSIPSCLSFSQIKLCQESINVAWLNFSIKESIVRKLYFLCYSFKMSRKTHIHCTCIYLFSFTIHKDLLWDYIKIIYCLKMSKKIFILFTIQNDLLRLILFHTYV